MKSPLAILNLLLYVVLDLTLIQNGIGGFTMAYWIINLIVLAISTVAWTRR